MISVIIPVYNVEAYLRRCIDSVLAQTYTDLEIILIDDGSPDNCGQICDEYAQADKRIRVIHQKNSGAAVARNAGLDAATGEYISFVDSDDYIDSMMLETLLNILTTHNADIVECGYRWVKPNVTYDRENTGKIDTYTNLEALEKLYFGDQMFGGISIVIWNKLYRADLLKNLRFIEGYMYEDCLFTPMALYAAEKIVKLNQNLYNFFFSPNSVTRSSYSMRKIDAVEVFPRVMDFYETVKLPKYYFVAQSSYFNHLFSNYYECRLRRKEKQFGDAAKTLKRTIKSEIPQMLQNPMTRKQAWRVRLFGFSPMLWFGVMYVGKRAKKYLKR